jgi:hypothetical protein
MNSVKSMKDMTRAGITKKLNESMRSLEKAQPVLPPPDYIPHCFTVCSLGRTLVLGASNDVEKQRWISSIQTRIDVLGECTHGWLKTSEGRVADIDGVQSQRCVLGGGNWKKSHFALLSTDMVQYKDEKLQDRIEVEYPLWWKGQATEIVQSVEVGGNTQNFGFSMKINGRHTYFMASDMPAKNEWIKVLQQQTLALTQARAVRKVTPVAQVYSRQEVMMVREENSWVERFLALSGDTLQLFESSENPTTLIKIKLAPSCVAEVVFDDTSANFQLFVVAPGVVLRMNCSDERDQIGWLANIRHAISESEIDHSDPIFIAAAKHALEYESGANMCSIRYEDRADLDLVMARQQQWALVREVGDIAKAAGVVEGAVLHAVNGVSVVMKTYKQATALIYAQQACEMQFRLPLGKKGALVKAPRSFVAGSHQHGLNSKLKGALNSKLKAWKSRYFVLANGELLYYNNENQDGSQDIQDCVPLSGTAVSLLKQEDTNKQFCFQLVVGTEKSVVLQAPNEEELLEWVSALYYSIAVANGGSYLVQQGVEALQKTVKESKVKVEAGDDGAETELEAAETELKTALLARAGGESEETHDGHDHEDKHDHHIEHTHAVPNAMLSKCYTAVKMVRGDRTFSKAHVALPAFMKSQQEVEEDNSMDEMPWKCPVNKAEDTPEEKEESDEENDAETEEKKAEDVEVSDTAYNATFTAYLVRASRQGARDWKRRVFCMQADHLLEYSKEQDAGNGVGARSVFCLEKKARILRNVGGKWVEVPVLQSMKEFEALASTRLTSEPSSKAMVLPPRQASSKAGVLPPPAAILPPPPMSGALPPPKLPPPATKVATTGPERRAAAARALSAKNSAPPSPKNALPPPAEEEITPPPSVAKFYFRLETGVGVLHLCAQNELEMFRWVDTINKHIQQTRTATVGAMKVSEGRWAAAGEAGMVQRAVLNKGNWKKVYLMLQPDRVCAFKEPSMSADSRWYEEDYELTKHPAVLVEAKVEMQGSTENNCIALDREGRKVYYNSESARDKEMWLKALKEAIERRPGLIDASLLLEGSGQGDKEEGKRGGLDHGAIKTGMLTKRAVISEGNWKDRFFRLFASGLTYYAEATAVKAKGKFVLTPNCLVYPTHLGEFSLAVVTPGRVLHVCAASTDEQQSWVRAIQGCINDSMINANDPIMQVARQRRLQEQLYDISWAKDEPLTFTCVQKRHWAIVHNEEEESSSPVEKPKTLQNDGSFVRGGVTKLASEASMDGHIDSMVDMDGEHDGETFSSDDDNSDGDDKFDATKSSYDMLQMERGKVQSGSAIHAINGQLVALKSYHTVMNMLQHEARPVNVTFRRAPEKIGTLTKQPTSIVNGAVKSAIRGQFKKWKERWVRLEY